MTALTCRNLACHHWTNGRANRENLSNVIDHDEISLFEWLSSRYPMAAAGLLDDLCYRLSALLENENRDHTSIANACETLARIFRPLDRQQLPESHPWDAAYAMFGRWLMRELPTHRDAVLAITGWSKEQMDACKTRYTQMVLMNRDDWNRAVGMLEKRLAE